MTKIVPAIERLLTKRRINPDTGCWEFTGYIMRGRGKYEPRSGYAYIRDDVEHGSKLILVHRLAFRELVGPIPDGCVVDHECCVRHCFFPQHLLAVKHSVNLALMRERRLDPADYIPF